MKALILAVVLILSAFGLTAENRALLVGIGRYAPPTGWAEVHGDADAKLLASALKANGYGDVTTLKNHQATKAAIVEALKALASRCRAGDRVFFLFSGHGQRVTDLNHDEGPKGFDEAIVPYDACKTVTSKIDGRFYNGENHLIDDELNPLFAAIKDKLGPQGELFIAIDACYSYDMERAPGEEDGQLAPARGTDEKLHIRNTPQAAAIPAPRPFSPGATMYVASACKSDERNFEYRAPDTHLYGALSYFIYLLTKTTMDFGCWAHAIEIGELAGHRIFRPFQHPQVKTYH